MFSKILSRRIHYLALVLIILTGCSALQPPLPTPEPVTIQFAYPNPTVVDYKGLAAEFKKSNPNVTVELQPTENAYGRDFPVSKADVLLWDVSILNSDFQPNILRVDDMLTISSESLKQDMIPGTLEALQINGMQYGIPAGISPYVAFVSPKRLADAKVSMPSPQWTLDDLVAVATRANLQQGNLSDPNYSIGFCTGGQFGFDSLIITYLFGGNIFDQLPNPTRVTMNTPENISALQWLADIRSKYAITPKPDVLGTGQPVDVGVLEQANKCAIWLGSFSDLYTTNWGASGENKPTVLPLPSGKTTLNMVSMDGYFILAQSKHPAVAWKWINFLIDHPEAAGGMIPPRISQINSKAFEQQAGYDVATVARNLPGQVVSLNFSRGNYRVMRPAFELYMNALNAVTQGQMSPAAALEAAQKEADKLSFDNPASP